MNEHLRRDSGLGVAWSLLLAALPAASLRPEHDLWRIRPVIDLRDQSDDLPLGPVIYVAIGGGRCRYVGQTIDVGRRLTGHASDRRNPDASARKRDTWEGLLLIPLVEASTPQDIDAVEALAGAMLRPDRHGGGAGRYPRP